VPQDLFKLQLGEAHHDAYVAGAPLGRMPRQATAWTAGLSTLLAAPVRL
jgi:hypothetical protein